VAAVAVPVLLVVVPSPTPPPARRGGVNGLQGWHLIVPIFDVRPGVLIVVHHSRVSPTSPLATAAGDVVVLALRVTGIGDGLEVGHVVVVVFIAGSVVDVHGRVCKRLFPSLESARIIINIPFPDGP
jgi:hypothetical protein